MSSLSQKRVVARCIEDVNSHIFLKRAVARCIEDVDPHMFKHFGLHVLKFTCCLEMGIGFTLVRSRSSACRF